MRLSISFLALVFLLCHHFSFAQTQTLNVYAQQEGGSVFIYADNDQLYPQSVKVTLSLKGLKEKEKNRGFSVVPPGSKSFVLSELVIPQNRSWSYKYNFIYYEGDINAEHDDDHAYRLPYQTGKSFRVVQGYNGKESHSGENALDFDLPEGEIVTAARSGRVIKIKEDSNRGCPSKSCAALGNYVTILHNDGTMADYYHLQKNGALVESGQTVEAGDEIGKAGNTGWATGAHLHFIVYKPSEKGRVTFPTRFKTEESGVIFLELKRLYKAVE